MSGVAIIVANELLARKKIAIAEKILNFKKVPHSILVVPYIFIWSNLQHERIIQADIVKLRIISYKGLSGEISPSRTFLGRLIAGRVEESVNGLIGQNQTED
jgi:hypothetical protein